MAALISKPGITSASTLSIPKNWDKAWFRAFIQNQLKGADVRNAVGVSGIVVSGTIASPYATIGFAAPITLPGPVIINGAIGSIALTVNGGADNNFVARFNAQNVAGNSNGLLINAGTNTSDTAIRIRNAAGTVNFFQIRGDGLIQGGGPTAGVLVDMTPDRGTFTLTHTGFTAGVTSTATWYKIGNVVILNTGLAQGTSNATTWTATGLPAALQSTLAAQVIVIGDVEDNGADTQATVTVSSGSGTLTFGKGSRSGGAFTNTGTKGFVNTGGTTFCYIVA